PAGRVHQLLLAGEERMARGADLDVDVGRGRTRLEGVSAGAVKRRRLVLRMDLRLHTRASRGISPGRTGTIFVFRSKRGNITKMEATWKPRHRCSPAVRLVLSRPAAAPRAPRRQTRTRLRPAGAASRARA